MKTMATVITLKIKDDQGNVTKKQHEIEDINLLQFEKMMEVIKEIIHELRSDGSLTDLVGQIFEGESSPGEDETDELARDAEFIMKIVNSFETLAIRMPKQAFKLLSVLTGIELGLLQQQKIIDVFDIYDAVVEENDIERLVNRVKKSLSVTMAKTKFLNLARKATAPVANLIQK
jgi:hypothetical protein